MSRITNNRDRQHSSWQLYETGVVMDDQTQKWGYQCSILGVNGTVVSYAICVDLMP